VQPPDLSRFSTILLDVNSTFMFGEDRFGPHYDYSATYTDLGGSFLGSDSLRGIIDSVVGYLSPIYIDSSQGDSFPQVREVLARLPLSQRLPADEHGRVEQVIASQEVGQIPDAYAAALRVLSRSHRLGIVSNLWSSKDLWLKELSRAEILDIIEVLVFSSDGTSMKPSPRLFQKALDDLAISPTDAVFVGDSLRCDVAGASATGMATIWIDARGLGAPANGPQPTWIVRDLLDLVAVERK
jgi:HAD superfamily hydrolase (TIGR01509 family)